VLDPSTSSSVPDRKKALLLAVLYDNQLPCKSALSRDHNFPSMMIDDQGESISTESRAHKLGVLGEERTSALE